MAIIIGVFVVFLVFCFMLSVILELLEEIGRLKARNERANAEIKAYEDVEALKMDFEECLR